MGTLSEQLRRLAQEKQSNAPASRQSLQPAEQGPDQPATASQTLRALAEARSREEELAEKRTIPGEAGAALKSIPRGLTGVASGTLRGLATLGNDPEYIEQSPLYRAGDAIDQTMDHALPIPEEYQGRLPVDVGGGVGSMAGFMMGGATGGLMARGASKVAGAGAKGQALATRGGQFGTAASMAGPAGADEAYQRSMQAGLSPEDAKANAIKGVVPGVVQIANINFLLRALPPKVRGRLFEGAKGRLLTDGLSESAVEGAGAVGQNMIEMGYNPETGLFDGAGYQALIGGLSAAGVQGTRLALRGDAQAAPKADVETGGTETGEAVGDDPLSTLAEQASAMPEDQAVDFLQDQLLSMMQAPSASTGGDVTPGQSEMTPPMQGLQITPEQPQAEQAPAQVQAPDTAEGDITEAGTGVFRVPTDQIQVDPQQYQFRSRVNQDGVDQRLQGVEQWDDRRAGNVLLHRREDGSLYVADGHHRVDLAKRLGQGEINANIMDEADGITVRQARIEAAMANVANEKAEALDVAKVFRDTDVPLDQVRSTYNLPSTQVVRDGESLSRLTDNVFGMVAAGQIADKDGAAIGRSFTDEAQQMAAADAFQKIQPSSEYQRELLIQEIRAADFMASQGEQSGLFGDDDVQISLMQQRLAILDELRKTLNRDKRLFKSLNDNADRANEAGNLIAAEANEAITDQSARSLDLIGRVTTTPELNEMVALATQRLAAGEAKSAVVKDLKKELMAYEQVQAGRTGNPNQRRQPPVRTGQDAGAGERVPESDTGRADGERESRLDREPAPEEVAPALELETQTEEQLAEQAQVQQEAADTKARQKREAEQREQADAEADDFVLSGSDSAIDQAEARGQNNLFDHPAEAKPARQSETEAEQQAGPEAKKPEPKSDITLVKSNAKDQGLYGWRQPRNGEGYVYALQRDGQEIGFLDLAILEGGEARIMDIVSNDGSNSIGARDVRRVMRKITELHPGIKEFTGERVSGIRRGGEHGFAGTGEEIRVPVSPARRVEQAAAEVDQNPTESQIEAGNYKKGHVTVQGLDITLENPRGSTRSGTDPDGNDWSVTMAHHYGYLKRTEGADGEHVDVFVGQDLDSDSVFVVDQVNADGTFDEHKVLLGFKNQVRARKGYKDNYTSGWKVGPITRMTMDEFKAWLEEGDLKKPLNPESAQTAKPEPAQQNESDSEKANQESDDPRFSRTGPRNLFVAHNLSESNLEHVLELGGLAAPSLAVGRTDQGFTDFGEITLLAPASMLESSRTRTFDADVYTPRHPRAEYEISRESYAQQVGKLDNEYDLATPALDDLERDGMEAMARSPAYQYAWLKSQNKAPKAKRQKVDPVIRKIAKLNLDRFAMQTDPRVIKLAEEHYRDVQKQVREALGEDAPRANIYFDEDGSLSHGHLSQLTYKAARYQDSDGYDVGQMKVDLNKKLRTKLVARQYERWIKDQFNEVVKSQRMFAGFTYSGNKKYRPYTLENVVKEMTRQVQGGEGFNYGAGSVRSAYAKEMRRVSEVQANRDRIVSPDQMAAIKEESNKRLQDTLEALKPYYKFDADGWGYMDDASSAIAEGRAGWNEAFNLDADSRAMITKLVDYLRNLPTDYFETKVGRAVDLSEFSVALVPKGTSKEAVDALRAKGLKVKRYDPEDADSRRQEIAKQEDLLFSREGDYRRTPDTQIESLTAEEARTIANGLMKGWKGRPGLTVADSISEFPARLRQAIRDAGAESDMRAVFWNQHVYVLAPRIPSRAALEEVILHEVVGHYGLRKMVGGELKPLLDRVYRDLGDSARARVIKRVYFANNFDPKNTEHRLTVAEELLAHLAESGKHQHRTLWQRIVTAIRDGLRRLGFTIQMAENDLLKILEGAQRTVEQGGFSRPSEAGSSFSRKQRELPPSDAALQKSLYSDRDSLFDGDTYVGDVTFADDNPALTDAEADLIAARTDTGNSFVEIAGVPLMEADAQKAIKIASSKQWYHGTADAEMTTSFEGERALFLTDSQAEAGTYSQGGAVMPFRVAPKNPLFVENTDATLDMESAQAVESLRDEGYDAIIPLDFGNVVVLSESALTTDNAGTFDPANPAIRFSRTGEQSESHQRQVKFMDGFATQPVDRLFRMVFDVGGMVDSHGRLKGGVKLTESAERAIKEWRPSPKGHFAWLDGPLETARHGLLDRHKLTADYKKAWRQAEAYGRALDMQALDILEKLESRGIDGAEAQVLQKILTGEVVPNHELNAVAPEILRAIDDLGQAAVEYGIITREQFERNRGEYLHRSYLRHETQFTGLGKWVHNLQRSRNRKIKGDTAKGRGQIRKVPTAQLMEQVPVGWYGVKKVGDRPDMKLLHEQEFIILENPGEIADATDTMEGMEIPTLKVRNKGTLFWPASEPVPARYEAWRNKGKWKVVGGNAGQVTLWRDWTKAERESMGEILDARYNIAMTFQKLSKDLAMGKFFQDVSLNSEWFSKTEPVDGTVLTAGEARTLSTLSKTDWVQVPTTLVSQSAGTKQWGALSGGYVRAEIWRDLNELDKMHNPGTWRAVLTQWKLNKTARSPVVHMNNVMSNLMLMDLADVRVTDLYKGIQSFRAKDEHWRAAQEHGAFEGTFINEEIRQRVLQPVLDELMQQNLSADPSLTNAVGTLSKLGYTLVKHLKRADQKMTQFYQLEDEIFRMATYMRRLDLGDSPAEAALMAREQFLDYDIRAPWINAARRTVLPFISYTYRAVPVVAQSIIHRPWKLAKYTTIAYLANALAYELAPGDEDEERRTMRQDQQGKTWLGTPRLVRMPWHDQHGNPVFVDVRRWVPAGDVYDMNQGQSALPIPAPIQWGGPIALAFEFVLNKQAFTGQEIVSRDTDTLGEATAKTASWLYKSWMPSAAYIPGSFYWDRVWTAAEGGRDLLGRPYSVPQALVSSVGIKAQPHDIRMGYEFRSRDLAAQARIIQGDIRRAQSDLQRNIISQREYAKVTEGARRKLERLAEQQRTLQGR